MRNARFWFIALVVAVFLLGGAAPVQAQGAFSHGTVVALQGTPHLWFADQQGILHWGGDTRALSGKHIAWNNHVEVSLDRLRTLPVGDPWLSAGLLKDGDPIYLVKWESDWPQPRLLHIQSIADVELFGINGSNYGNFVIDRPTWEARYGISAAGLQRGTLATTTVPGVSRNNPIPIGTAVDFEGSYRLRVVSVVRNAGRVVAEENMFNDPPDAGNQFFMVRLAVTRLKPGIGGFLFDGGEFETLGSRDFVYLDFKHSCGVIPDELDVYQDVGSGFTLEGNMCWQIHSADVDSLVLKYYPEGRHFGSPADVRYFALR